MTIFLYFHLVGAYKHALENVWTGAKFLAIHPHLGTNRLEIHAQHAVNRFEWWNYHFFLLLLGEVDGLLVCAITFFSALYHIHSGWQLAAPSIKCEFVLI